MSTRRSISLKAAPLLFFLLSLSFATGIAQDFRATLNGTVTDSSGAVVPGAAVRAQNKETGEVNTVQTSAQGDFTIPFLRPGTYSVSAEAAGFKRVLRENIVLRQGQALSVTLALEPGAVGESINVIAESPLLETEKADRGTIIDNKRVTEIPISARNPVMLSALVAGVSFRGGSQRGFDQSSINRWSINGSPVASTAYLLDGAPNDTQLGNSNVGLVPSIDAVAEFRIHTNAYDAQYGKTGGGIVSVAMKSGTNEFHGSVFEFARRGNWSANSFPNNRNNSPRGQLAVDQFGGQAGGPVRLPKLYDGRNRTFFMVSYEKYKDDDPRPTTFSVPAPEFLNGDFSKLVDNQGRPITIYNPFSGRQVGSAWVRDPFPGNKIPQNLISPLAQKILGYMAEPNRDAGPNQGYSFGNLFQPGGVNNWTNNFYNFAVKVDHNFGAKHKVYFRFANNDRVERKNTNGNMDSPGQTEAYTSRINKAFVADWVGALRPTFLANLRVSFNRFIETADDRDNFGFDLASLGLPSSLINQLPNPSYFGRYSFEGYNPGGQATSMGFDTRRNVTNNYAIHPSVTWIRGSHSIKAGLDARLIHYAIGNVGDLFRLNATRRFTQRDHNQAGTDPFSGNSIASFLLGAVESGGATYTAQPYVSSGYYAPYFQDDWKVSRKLTLNLGLRFDLQLLPYDRFDRLNRGFAADEINPVNQLIDRTTFPDVPPLKGGILFAGENGLPRRTGEAYRRAIQPRFGMAYQITPQLVFRGGWGRTYMNPSNAFIQTNGFSFTNQAVTSLDGGLTPRADFLTNPFPNGIRQPDGAANGLLTFMGQGFSFVNPDFRLPYLDHFSAGFQMRLPLESVIEVSYIGSRGNDLESSRPFNDIPLSVRQQCYLGEGGNPNFCNANLPNPFVNLAPFAGTARFSSTRLTRAELERPYPHFGGITELGRNDGKSWYNSMQVSFETRRKAGMNIIATYTLSKWIARDGWLDVQRNIMQQGLTEGDRPHRFTLGVVSELPFGQGKPLLNTSHRFWGRLAGGWQLNAFYQMQSGLPWAIPASLAYLKDARLPDIDWSAEVVRGVKPCVARWNNNGAMTMEPYSVSYGCPDYNFLILPSFAPRLSPSFDGRLRNSSRPNLDFSLNKTTRITERTSVQFRAEVFNATNAAIRPNLSSAFDSNFGVSLKTNSGNASAGAGALGAPRTIQLGVKFLF
jgi:Carboxypeptidase regulatory-like domain/TonB dependent receptor